MAFNTHEAVKALKSSGFNEKQAESVVETIDNAVNETVATKSDLALLAADLEVQGAKIDALRETVEGIQENIKENMATKADLAILTKTVEGIQENIDKNMATRTDLANLERRMMRMMLIQTLVLVGLLIPVIAKLLL